MSSEPARLESRPVISDQIPDWSRETPTWRWNPGQRLLTTIRSYQKWHSRGGLLGKVMSKVAIVRHRFWSVVSGADIPPNCHLGGGLSLLHPTGIVIHPDAEIGPNCLILQQVTITGRVVIGGHVDIGAGAKIIGPLTIGSHAKIGANAVVLKDVPDGCTAVGIPARIVRSR